MILHPLLATSSTGLVWVAGGGVALLVASAVAHLVRRQSRRDASEHIVRLATEIIAIASTIEADLAHVGPNTPFARFGQQSRDDARRARNAMAARERLPRRRAQVLRATLVLLHEDHRHIVDLRSEFDTALALWANCHPRDRHDGAARPDGAEDIANALVQRNSTPLARSARPPSAGPSSTRSA